MAEMVLSETASVCLLLAVQHHSRWWVDHIMSQVAPSLSGWSSPVTTDRIRGALLGSAWATSLLQQSLSQYLSQKALVLVLAGLLGIGVAGGWD